MWAHYLDSLIAMLCTYSSENVDMMVEDAHKGVNGGLFDLLS
jgi:hypothetical protein